MADLGIQPLDPTQPVPSAYSADLLKQAQDYLQGPQAAKFNAAPPVTSAPTVGVDPVSPYPTLAPPAPLPPGPATAPGAPPIVPAGQPVIQSVDPTANFKPMPPAAPGAPARGPAATPNAGIIQAGDKTAQAITAEGDAAKAAADAEAEARRQGEQQIAEQNQRLRDAQIQRDQAVRQLNEDTKAAYEQAHQSVIPDFWKDKPGQQVAAAVLVGLGAVGQGLLAFGTATNVGNGAQQIINHAVDSYYERKKQEVDNLYRYAEMKGKLNDQQKLDWATKLNDLQFQIAFTHQSIQDHIAEVNAQSKGRIDQAHFAQLSAAQGERTQQALQAAQMQRAQINHLKNEDALGWYNAKTGRLAATEKANQAGGKAEVFGPDGKLLGFVTSGRGGAEAFSTRDADFTKAANALKALAADIAQNGDRVFSPEAVKRRDTLKNNADIAIGTVSSLGKSDEALKKESGSIGSGGSWSVMGANPEAVSNKIREVEDQQERYRRQGLIGYQPAGQTPAASAAEKPAQMQVGNTIYRLQPDGTYK